MPEGLAAVRFGPLPNSPERVNKSHRRFTEGPYTVLSHSVRCFEAGCIAQEVAGAKAGGCVKFSCLFVLGKVILSFA